MTPVVATSTPMEGAGLGLVNLNVNTAEHGRISPALKDGTVLPPKAVELFARNDKGVLWFAGPPLDVVPLPKPHHSVEYLAKRQKLQNGKARGASDSNGSSRANEAKSSNQVANGIHVPATATATAAVPDLNMDEVLPIVVHGLEALKEQLNRDVQVIQSN